jgi:transposase
MTDNLERAGRKLRSARKAQKDAMEAARLAALEALDHGHSEVEVASTLGVDRMTVRKWGGKR